MNIDERLNNPLVKKSISGLMLKYALPAILSFMVNAIYNIVDQIFIGNLIGPLGNAATTVAFPLNTICTAFALLVGVGTASNYSLCKGRGEDDKAERIMATGLSMVSVIGIITFTLVMIFLKPMVVIFGATEKIMGYTLSYTQITSYGIFFIMISIASVHLIRADGSPRYAMIATMSGAILNIFLDYIFMVNFNMGIAGAAYATFIGQILSFIMSIYYLFKLKEKALKLKDFKLKLNEIKAIAELGSAAFLNQLAMVFVQIVMNNVMTTYGGLSKYGKDIPLAGIGIVSKVNVILIAFNVGLAQGAQPIIGYNYGAGVYERVKKTYLFAVKTSLIFSTFMFLIFQFKPDIIISIFGKGNSNYIEFCIKLMKIGLFMTFANGIQPISANFFTSIGKSMLGIFMSMTRQIIFYIPLILLLPKFMGIEGALLAAPIGDFAALVIAVIFAAREFKKMDENKKDLIHS